MKYTNTYPIKQHKIQKKSAWSGYGAPCNAKKKEYYDHIVYINH